MVGGAVLHYLALFTSKRVGHQHGDLAQWVYSSFYDVLMNEVFLLAFRRRLEKLITFKSIFREVCWCSM